jgi:hypothetical protein
MGKINEDKTKFTAKIVEEGIMCVIKSKDLKNPDGSDYKDVEHVWKLPFGCIIRTRMARRRMYRRFRQARKLYEEMN